MLLALILLACSEPPVPPEPLDAHLRPDAPPTPPPPPQRPAVRCTTQAAGDRVQVTTAVVGGSTWTVTPIAGPCAPTGLADAACAFRCGEAGEAVRLKIAWDGPRLTAWTRATDDAPWTRHWRAPDAP